jgi:hypothetical protein
MKVVYPLTEVYAGGWCAGGRTDQNRDGPTEATVATAEPVALAAAARAAKVFLFLLPGGCPWRGAEGGEAATAANLAFLPLPRGRPGP